jgi:hypothetical protein
MLLGLFLGHLIFMCYCWKTTNESLKRGDKYKYFMKQFQVTTWGLGPLNFAWLLCCKRRTDSLVSNDMVMEAYKHKIQYMEQQSPVLKSQMDPNMNDDQLATPEPASKFNFELFYLQKIVGCAKVCNSFLTNKVHDKDDMNNL